jgi:predicted RNA-binding protein (virulence factor B family)
MLKFGKFNTLTITDIHQTAILLDGGEAGEIVLHDKELPQSLAVGQSLDVFIYIDGKNQVQATRQRPKAQAGDVAWLKVVSLSHAGAFLDWGLPKDLLVPFSEQRGKMVEGRSYLVKLFLDEDNRIAASTRLDDFLQDEAIYLKDGQEVDLIIAEETDLGFKAVVNHQYWGVLYKNEVFQPLHRGQALKGFVKKIREDKRIDLMLTPPKYGQKLDTASEKVLAKLTEHGGWLPVSDKSPPELIYDTFGISKKAFKEAIGSLYKQRLIVIQDGGIEQIKAN